MPKGQGNAKFPPSAAERPQVGRGGYIGMSHDAESASHDDNSAIQTFLPESRWGDSRVSAY